jgi:hypothetical protein
MPATNPFPPTSCSATSLTVLPSTSWTLCSPLIRHLDSSTVVEVTYSYRVITLNTGGLAVSSEPQIARVPSLSPVQIEALEFEEGAFVRLCAEEDGIRPSGEVLLKGNPAWAAA